ncbi:hypothetical protein Tco_0990665 [Tanacetum coccineum]|uniref:Uncharacterized protein n=1 Tax=Tanacetum coccineum TaxID=301880 RepID=A0ABQ5EX44_9ASTR
MGDENPIRTLGDYSKPSHEGYRNTIELPAGNNVVPLRSDTIRLVQNGCSFYRLRSEDPNQQLKDFLKLMDSLDLDNENRERMHAFCEIDRAADRKLRNKNDDESWEIIENFSLYDYEGWYETIPEDASLDYKNPDIEQLLGIMEHKGDTLIKDTISLMGKSESAFCPSELPSAKSNEPPKLNTFTFHERTGPSPQPQALETTFKARIWESIFKQREGINSRMTKMFRLLKELTTSRTPKKVLIREEAKFPITKNLNSISLTKEEEERSNMMKVTPDNTEKPTATEEEMPVIEAETKNGAENRAENKSIKTPENEETVEAPVGKKKGKEYKVLPGGPVYDAILKKMITKKEDIRGNFKITYSVRDLKHVNALVYQGFNVNIMPYSTYMKLTDERPAETYIKLSLASQSYIYPLGIAEDVLVDVAEYVYPIDFGTITLRSGNSKASPGMRRKDKASLGKGDEVQPMEEQKFQRKASHSYCNQRRNGRLRRPHVKACDFVSSYKTRVPLQAEQADWLADTDEEIDEQELEAHYSFMAKIQEVLPEESSSTEQPLEQVQNLNENNVDQNVTECDDERAALANLIENLTLDTEENKTILKQLKKANASLTQELEKCKTNLDETSRALGEATSYRDSCLIALQNKQNELEKIQAFNERTIDYDKSQTKLNETSRTISS